MRIKYPLAKETINEDDINALCNWLKKYPRLTKGELTPQQKKEWAVMVTLIGLVTATVYKSIFPMI